MFIIDQNNHLIAADTADLERWGFSDILDAVRAFREGSLRFEKEVGILLLPDDSSLTCKVDTLDSLLGTWYLCHPLREEISKEAPGTPTETEEELLQILPESQEEESTEAESAPSAISEEQSREAEKELEALLKLLPEEEETTPPSSGTEEETPLSLLTEEEEAATAATSEEAAISSENEEESSLLEIPMEEEEETLQLMAEEPSETAPTSEAEAPLALREEETEQTSPEEELPLAPEEETQENLTLEASEASEPLISLPEAEEKAWLKLEAAFKPDLQTNAVNLDLGTEEYTALVSDFVHDCRQMRGELLEGDVTARREATSVLKDAVTLLQLSPIDRLLDMIESASPEERTEIVDTLDRMLGRLEQPETANTGPSAVETVRETEKPVAAPEQAEMETPIAEEKAETPPAVQPEVSTESFLKGVKPVPIEFSLQIAAEELNLPEDLVLEFINDFANQGHEYLPVLIDAYEKKDLDQLQKTAHMLKGAASNLRVEAMVENLYELQFDNDIERAPERIRKFAGQLMSLDNFLKQLNG